MKYILEEINYFFIFIITNMPGRTGVYIRRFYLKLVLKEVGKNLYTESGIVITGHKNIILKDNVRIMRHSSINADGGSVELGNNISLNYNVNINCSGGGNIFMGDNVLIGQNTVIRSADHKYSKNIQINKSGHISGDIKIKNNVWIGANCVILKNVIIEDNCVIGANSTITKNIEQNKVVVGVDKIIKEI